MRAFLYPLFCIALLGSAAAAPPEAASGGKLMFDGKSLTGWKLTDFAGHGEVTVKDNCMDLAAGEPLTGANYTGEVPANDYEISLEAMRVDGSDFFCGLTFPVGPDHVTFVVGGWGGTVVGISSINSDDASENETTQYKKFDTNKWYKIRVRVTTAKLEAWIDDEQVVNVTREEKRFSMRSGEIELSLPCGVASYRTHASLRNIRLTTLPASAPAPAAPPAAPAKQ